MHYPMFLQCHSLLVFFSISLSKSFQIQLCFNFLVGFLLFQGERRWVGGDGNKFVFMWSFFALRWCHGKPLLERLHVCYKINIIALKPKGGEYCKWWQWNLMHMWKWKKIVHCIDILHYNLTNFYKIFHHFVQECVML